MASNDQQQTPKIPTSVKTGIINEWLALFPELKKYKPTMLMCRKGAALIGIEFIWLMGNRRYRPHFRIMPLIPNGKGKIDSFIVYDFEDPNGRQLDLPIESNSLQTLKANTNIRELILKQCWFRFDRDVTIKDIVDKLMSVNQETENYFGNNNYYTNRELLVYAGILKDDNKQYADYAFEYALDVIKEKVKNDISTRKGFEHYYSMKTDEIISKLTTDYKTIDYKRVVDETVKKFKLEKF